MYVAAYCVFRIDVAPSACIIKAETLRFSSSELIAKYVHACSELKYKNRSSFADRRGTTLRPLSRLERRCSEFRVHPENDALEVVVFMVLTNSKVESEVS